MAGNVCGVDVWPDDVRWRRRGLRFGGRAVPGGAYTAGGARLVWRGRAGVLPDVRPEGSCRWVADRGRGGITRSMWGTSLPVEYFGHSMSIGQAGLLCSGRRWL
ncbi:hypothetical protein GCM10010252_09410 [Streptomyces aureoverticillatus]|nr:hypothetical protein GCM10010252_09410 [Streptomyces aureoverticillatus]